jgi:hypothetical protein
LAGVVEALLILGLEEELVQSYTTVVQHYQEELPILWWLEQEGPQLDK